MKKAISVLLLLCMFVSLFSAMAFAVDEPEPAAEAVETTAEAAADTTDAAAGEEEAEVKSIFNSKLYVRANPGAGLAGEVAVKFDLIGSTGTLYLPGKADASQLCFSWDCADVTVSRNGTVYESGAAPVALAGEKITYKVQKGLAFAYITVKTMQGSADVKPMFLELDETQGTIAAMNADDTHETKCVGNVIFDGASRAMSMKGRGNSTWVFPKKPYNITLDKKAVMIPGIETKKWSLLANYLDNALLRNKVAMDLADELGIGLKSCFIDIWMNGEYIGNYLMTPKSDYAAPKGGYHLENDNYLDAEDPQFKIPGMYAIGDTLHDDGYYNLMTIKDIGSKAGDAGIGPAEIEAYFTEAWYALEDFSTENYQNYFDLDSWAKMFLMYEFTKTYDCFAGSLLMHRDGLTENDKLVAGPAWDYDISLGRTLHKFLVGVSEPLQLNAEGWYNDGIGIVAVDKPVSLLQELGRHASFMRAVARVYNEYKYAFEGVAENVDIQREAIRASALMNNDVWGTHSLSADYLVAPNTMSLLGTGKYAVRYDVTLTWDNYVNNVKEFATKRAMWLSDHLWQAVEPQGSIVKKTTADGGVVLQAVLTAGNEKNTYQWQVLEDGVWVDIEGATAVRYQPEAVDAEYRCIVRNEGAVITTHHGGRVPTYAETALDPAFVTVVMEETVLEPGEFTLALNGKDMGEYTFAKVKNGWTIRNASGKYLSVSGSSISWTKNAAVWQYENGVFSTSATAARTTLGKLITLGYQRNVYLTVNDGKLAVSTASGAAATLLKPIAE